MSGPINYQIIEQDGKPAFAVVPYEEFQALIDEKDSTTIPHAVVAIAIEQDCNLIKAWRLHKNLTQKEVAERADMSQPAYQQLEKSKGKFQRRTLEKLAVALNVDPNQLVE